MRGGKKENREMSHKWVPPANKDPELTNTHEFLDLLLLPLVQVAPLSAAEIQNHRAREDELHKGTKKRQVVVEVQVTDNQGMVSWDIQPSVNSTQSPSSAPCSPNIEHGSSFP